MDNDKKLIALINAINSVMDEIGIHPKSVIKNGVEVLRTQYGEGWNDCKIRHTDLLCNALDSVEKSHFNADLQLLLLAEVGWIINGELFLNMNDVFYYACADAEKVPEDKIKEVAALFRQFGFAGLTFWVSQKRNELPKINKHAKDVEYVKERLNIS